MLDIDMEYRKCILFVRLGGDFTTHNCTLLDNKLKSLVDNNNVRFIAFNVSNLHNIDLMGINTILKYNSALSKINGKAFICGIDNKIVKSQVSNSSMLHYIFDTTDELGAIHYLSTGGYL